MSEVNVVAFVILSVRVGAIPEFASVEIAKVRAVSVRGVEGERSSFWHARTVLLGSD